MICPADHLGCQSTQHSLEHWLPPTGPGSSATVAGQERTTKADEPAHYAACNGSRAGAAALRCRRAGPIAA